MLCFVVCVLCCLSLYCIPNGSFQSLEYSFSSFLCTDGQKNQEGKGEEEETDYQNRITHKSEKEDGGKKREIHHGTSVRF